VPSGRRRREQHAGHADVECRDREHSRVETDVGDAGNAVGRERDQRARATPGREHAEQTAGDGERQALGQ
jgi:hypothetical protein